MHLIYCRVSTTEQADGRAVSLSEQERKGRVIAEMRGAWAFDIGLFSDAGVSGSIPLSERPEGERMLAAAVEGDTLVAAKLDRMFRSASDALVTSEGLRKRGISLILADIDPINPLESSPTAKLFFTIVAAFGEFERGRIAERITEGKRGKRARQGHLGGQAPYGFRVEGIGRDAKLVPHEEERIKVSTIKTMMERGSPSYVAKELERLGMRDRAGNPFRITQLQRIRRSQHATG